MQNKKLATTLNDNKKSHMWRRWDTPQNFFLAFIDELKIK